MIERKVAETHLDRHLAAIVVASENQINIARYATSDELAAIRGTLALKHSVAPTYSPIPAPRRTLKGIEPIALNLVFISSNELRQILQRDLAELNIARSQGLDKTSKICIVLSGSIAEAILLDCLLQHEASALAIGATLPKSPGPSLEDWDLATMVTVATRLGLLPDDASASAGQLRQWRNLIHPGRELKDTRAKRIRPTLGRARNSISFLQFIAEELKP
jgi:hypothetical protein